MQLFYFKDCNEFTTSFSFDKEESKHIIKVLRKKDGDILYVTNGLGYLFITKITFAAENKCTVSIESLTKEASLNYKLHLAVAPTKMNERYEWFIEKVVEIGVHEITPIICDNSERKVVKLDRFEKIALSAMKQSNQLFLPIINEPISLKDFLKTEFEGQKFIAHCEESSKKMLKNEVESSNDIVVLIGPEGDFSSKEIQLALQNDYIPVSLGNTRLRTETAGIVACTMISLIN